MDVSPQPNLPKRILFLPAPDAVYDPLIHRNNVLEAASDAPLSVALVDREASKPPKCHMDSECAEVKWILAELSDADRGLFTATDRTIEEALSETKPKHLKTLHKSLDCSIMDVADDIAFGVHDLEDATALGLVTIADWENPPRSSPGTPSASTRRLATTSASSATTSGA